MKFASSLDDINAGDMCVLSLRYDFDTSPPSSASVVSLPLLALPCAEQRVPDENQRPAGIFTATGLVPDLTSHICLALGSAKSVKSGSRRVLKLELFKSPGGGAYRTALTVGIVSARVEVLKRAPENSITVN